MKQTLLWHIQPETGVFGSEPRHEYIIDMLRMIIEGEVLP